jgi:hypothetical protein
MGGLCIMVAGGTCVEIDADRLIERHDTDFKTQSLSDASCNPVDFNGRSVRVGAFVAEACLAAANRRDA